MILAKLSKSIDLDTNPYFNHALKRFLINGWELKEIKKDMLFLVHREGKVVKKKILLCPDQGVRISTIYDDWIWSEWSVINDVTKNL